MLVLRFLGKTNRFEQPAAAIAQLFAEHELSVEQLAAITVAYNELPGQPAVAIRSSANAEDLPDLSPYGKQVFNLDFAEPALIDAPLPFITNLKAMVRNPGFDLTARQREVARKRRSKWLQAVRYFFTRRVTTVARTRTGGAVSRTGCDRHRQYHCPRFHRCQRVWDPRGTGDRQWHTTR